MGNLNAGLQHLSTAVAALETAVTAAVAALANKGDSDAAVEAAAEVVDAQTAALNAAVAPPAPTS